MLQPASKIILNSQCSPAGRTKNNKHFPIVCTELHIQISINNVAINIVYETINMIKSGFVRRKREQVKLLK